MTSTVPLTRGFLFADLRGYTAFVERHSDAAGADLLDRYRALVRQIVAASDGAEVRTEGDSFYIVFPSASSAVAAGLAIVEATDEAGLGDRTQMIRVGVGINVGEAEERPDGYVGSAVNLAARVCAVARPGEVLVTDTVRRLVRTSGRYTFTTRGRPTFKGIGESIDVFAVTASTALPAVGDHLSSVGSRHGWSTKTASARIPAGAAIVVVLSLLVAVAGPRFVGVGASTTGPSGPPASRGPGPSSVSSAASAPASRLDSSPMLPTSPSPSSGFASPPPLLPVPDGVALAPGTYRSKVMQPPLIFTAGSGWTTFGDDFGNSDAALDLVRADAPGDRLTFIWSDLASTDGCIEHHTSLEVPGGTYAGTPPALGGSLPTIDRLIRGGALSGGPWLPRPGDPSSHNLDEHGVPLVVDLAIDVGAARLPKCPVAQPRGIALFHRAAMSGGEAAADDWTYLPAGGAARILATAIASWPDDGLTVGSAFLAYPGTTLVVQMQAANQGDLEAFVGEAETLVATVRLWPWSTPPP